MIVMGYATKIVKRVRDRKPSGAVAYDRAAARKAKLAALELAAVQYADGLGRCTAVEAAQHERALHEAAIYYARASRAARRA